MLVMLWLGVYAYMFAYFRCIICSTRVAGTVLMGNSAMMATHINDTQVLRQDTECNSHHHALAQAKGSAHNAIKEKQ